MKNWLGDLVVWLAAPVWQNVSRSLSEYYRNSTSRRDRAYDEEAAAERRRVSELPGADQHIGAAANTAVDDSIASATQ